MWRGTRAREFSLAYYIGIIFTCGPKEVRATIGLDVYVLAWEKDLGSVCSFNRHMSVSFQAL